MWGFEVSGPMRLNLVEPLSGGLFFIVGNYYLNGNSSDRKHFVVLLLNSSGSVTLAKKFDHASDSITLNAITTSADGFVYLAGR